MGLRLAACPFSWAPWSVTVGVDGRGDKVPGLIALYQRGRVVTGASDS